MEDLPESLLANIIKRITSTSDLNSLSLVSKRLYAVEAEQRDAIRVGCRIHPSAQGLALLCSRFPNLTKVEIVYSGWISNHGKQLDNQGLLVLSRCPSLTDLTLSFCSFINDSGLGYLALCHKLRSLKLNFTPAVSSNGLLSVVVGCKNLSALHLIRCMKVSSVEWLEYLGRAGSVEELVGKKCRGVSQDGLLKFGPGWKRLRKLEFEMDTYYRLPKAYDGLSMDQYLHGYDICCENLKDVSLVSCTIEPEKGLAVLFGRCKALERLQLDLWIGVKDSSMIALSRSSSNLRSISLTLTSLFFSDATMNNTSGLTDDSLVALALGCPMLEVVELSIPDGEFPTLARFTLDGVVTLIQSCPVRVLVLNGACFFNDIGMSSLCSAQFLETLELVKCHGVSDAGIQFIMQAPSLSSLRLRRCLGVTNNGIAGLVHSDKLDSLTIENCPRISADAVQGAARSVYYSQDLSWLH